MAISSCLISYLTGLALRLSSVQGRAARGEAGSPCSRADAVPHLGITIPYLITYTFCCR